MRNLYLCLLLSFYGCFNVFAQGNTAAGQQGFCAGNAALTFPNTTNSPPASFAEASSYGCLATRPNPAWFYLRVENPGTLQFNISQSTLAGAGIDVDFIAWGPFVGPPPIFGPANLNPSTQVACSYSPAPVENFTITNAQAGMYYVVLITNFSNQPGRITLTQTNSTNPNAGSTSCDIICELMIEQDAVICPGGFVIYTSTIVSEPNKPATYQWYRDDQLIPGATSVSYTVTMPGTYKVVVNKPGCVANSTDTAVVSAPPPLPLNNPQDLVVCGNGSGPYTYNLRSIEAAMLGSLSAGDYSFTYYETEAAAWSFADPWIP
ncbi:hypothetical protein LRS05_07335 [Flavobacterium sp. J372]|uniref:hypothetical protein n=1 Tax=Flavobacterium sp. J372 TaxID=2898436 RepID=UPI00215168A0|nr:hypothetical protein [Flavobacterium sp. J372]MCR5861960.1 hypothetical protein [Flavobacterium sp. J372]